MCHSHVQTATSISYTLPPLYGCNLYFFSAIEVMNLIETAEPCIWGYLFRSHQIQTMMRDGKVSFKKLYTFVDHLNQKLEPRFFKVVIFDEDIANFELKKKRYYMISDFSKEGQNYILTQNSFICSIQEPRVSGL